MSFLYEGRHFPDLSCATRENLRDFFYETQGLKQKFLNRGNTQDGWWRFSIFMKRFEESMGVFELFYQPSTRTYYTTKVAAGMLGASVDGVTSPTYSSIAKGESLKATVRTFARIGYRIFVLRYQGKQQHAARTLAKMCKDEHLDTSIICAGENNERHPMQALCDGYTVFEEKKGDFLEGNLMYAVVGDLSDSRTAHDFLDVATKFGARGVVGVSGHFNNMPDSTLSFLRERDVPYTKTSNILSWAQHVDVWYFTRYQQEYKWVGWLLKKLGLLRLMEKYWYARWYGVSDILLQKAKQNSIFLHPLPHGPEYPDDIHLRDTRFKHYDPMIVNSLLTKMQLIYMITEQLKKQAGMAVA